MPFAAKEFDWVFSNAVIEHVGDAEDQFHFLLELLRVARNVFFTTPNRFFPVETHTRVLFSHWRRNWKPKRKSTLPLRLLGFGEVRDLMERTGATFQVHKNRLMGWPMTFTVVASRITGS
jgi:hypothetical protein